MEASVDLNLASFFDRKVEKIIEITPHLKEKPQIDFRPELGINKDLEHEKGYSDGIKYIKSGVFKSVYFYGQDIGKDLKPFVQFYDMFKDFGLKTKVHVGEFSDYESINYTIKLLAPNELQHGLSAVDSKNNNIRLNICPTSNILLGAVTNIKKHSIRQLFDYGIKVTVNTDDPILFNISVTDEFVKLAKSNIFTFEELETNRKKLFSSVE